MISPYSQYIRYCRAEFRSPLDPQAFDTRLRESLPGELDQNENYRWDGVNPLILRSAVLAITDESPRREGTPEGVMSAIIRWVRSFVFGKRDGGRLPPRDGSAGAFVKRNPIGPVISGQCARAIPKQYAPVRAVSD